MTDILITGGIGDVVAIETHWTEIEKNAVTRVYWATRVGRQLIPLFDQMYPNVQHIDLYDYETRTEPYIHDRHVRDDGKFLPSDVVDRSIDREFPRIARENRKISNSRFLNTKLGDIWKFDLPRDYAVVVPYTPDNPPAHQKQRNFTARDWDNTLARLERLRIPGVVVNSACPDPVPDDPSIVDLTGKTTLGEAIEVVKGCAHYVGIDSWASILSGLRLPGEKLCVMTRNAQYVGWSRCYMPLHHREDGKPACVVGQITC